MKMSIASRAFEFSSKSKSHLPGSLSKKIIQAPNWYEKINARLDSDI